MNTNNQTKKMPKFLVLLFFTEMWERFSYYGMRALLVLFLTTSLGFSDKRAYAIYCLFAALGYAGPVIGGIIADKLLGFRSMVLIGSIIMTIGHLLMTIIPANESFLYLGLGFIAIGTGMFKGNITNLLGCCYEKNDPQRDHGFTLFYVAVNVGSVLASLSCAAVAKIFGWHYGFGLAGIGMILGLITFMKYQYVLEGKGLKPEHATKIKMPFNINKSYAIFMLSIVLSIMAGTMIYHSELFTKLLTIFGIGVLCYLGYLSMALNTEERKNILLLVILTFFLMLFFALEMQLGSLFNLFTERNIQKQIFGWEIPAAFSQAINPFTIIIMGPMLAGVFTKAGNAWSMRRFGLGIATMIFCFLTLYVGCLNADAKGMVSFNYLFISIAFMGLGELCLGPLINNLYTSLSPTHLRGFMMGVLMLSLSFSNLAGNLIAMFMSIPQGTGQLDTIASLSIYQDGFLKIMWFNVAILLAFVALYPLLNKQATKTNKNENVSLEEQPA